MDYLEYTFLYLCSDEQREILVALLDKSGYEGFVEQNDELIAYIREDQKNEKKLSGVLSGLHMGQSVRFRVRNIPETNWNARWESGFDPIVIGNKVRVRASFHRSDPSFKYEILINPKMSFGTGHHPTTRLMVKAMLDLNLSGLRVLDYGTGTGILAIVSEYLGAYFIRAIDMDKNAYLNCMENIAMNRCKNIGVQYGNLTSMINDNFNLILSNINRNVILDEVGNFLKMLDPGGSIIVSGIMHKDENKIKASFDRHGLYVHRKYEEGEWISMICKKSSGQM